MPVATHGHEPSDLYSQCLTQTFSKTTSNREPEVVHDKSIKGNYKKLHAKFNREIKELSHLLIRISSITGNVVTHKRNPL
jgi:hypothetical protein